jgi:hypothetical protein
MGLSLYLYNAPDSAGPITYWNRMHAQPIGKSSEIRKILSELFPEAIWECSRSKDREFWSALRSSSNGPYLDLTISEEEPSSDFQILSRCVYFIVCRKAPPSIMRTIMERFSLSCVCCPETEVMIDPYAYEDHDRFYVVKPWKPP